MNSLQTVKQISLILVMISVFYPVSINEGPAAAPATYALQAAVLHQHSQASKWLCAFLHYQPRLCAPALAKKCSNAFVDGHEGSAVSR